MIASGAVSPARVSASAMMSRPSASACRTSTVVPLRIRSTSPTRIGSAFGMFSVSGSQPSTATGQFSCRRVDIAASTVAAPAMSAFIVASSAFGLSARPPASYVTPLPTSAIRRVAGVRGR